MQSVKRLAEDLEASLLPHTKASRAYEEEGWLAEA